MPEIGAERAATLRRMAAAPDLHEYEALLLAHVEPVVLPAGLEWNESAFGESTREQRRRLLRRKRWWSFLPRIQRQKSGSGPALFEAGLEEFNRACPGLAVEHDHGCVDLWIHYFPDRGSIEVPLDGWDLDWWLEGGHDVLAAEVRATGDLPTLIPAVARGLQLMLDANS